MIRERPEREKENTLIRPKRKQNMIRSGREERKREGIIPGNYERR